MQVGEILKSFCKLPVFLPIFVLLNEGGYKLQEIKERSIKFYAIIQTFEKGVQ